jgi:outer membrane protein assembly factor BamB/predicted phosphodiesterase
MTYDVFEIVPSHVHSLILSLFLSLILNLIFSSASAQTQNFRFAWLSDTHVGSATAEEDLRRSMHDINSMNEIAFTILSGDITELGWNEQFRLAKIILDSLKKPYFITPGNHDTKWSESGCTEFSKIWGSDKFAFEYGRRLPTVDDSTRRGLPTHRVVDDSLSGLRFIGLHEGPIMKMGDGHFPPEDLRWLDSVLTHLPDKNQPLVFVTHYPLDNGIDNWYEFIGRVKHFNTQAVLVGHGHGNKAYTFEGIPGTMGRSNLRARQPVGGYTIVDIRNDTMLFSERIPGQETKSPWRLIPLLKHDYRLDSTAHDRPDFSINKRFPSVHLVWKYESGYTIASTPAVVGNRVIVGNSSGTVECLSLDMGTRLWSFSTGATVYSTPQIADGKVVFGSSDRNIYCLDVPSGKPLWKLTTGAPVVAAPSIENGVVYIGGSDGKFRAIDLSSGKLKWVFDGVGAFVETKPLLYKGKVIFGAWDTYLYALNTNDGSLAWKWSNGNKTLNLSPAACWPVASGGKIFIVAPDRAMTAIDAETGTTVWRSSRYQVREMIGVSEDGSRIYARCMTDTVVAFSPTAASQEIIWVTNCGYGYDIDPSMPREKDGTVFFGTKNGLVFALDGKSGALRWEYKIGVTIVNTLVPLDARHVVATDLDGRVMLIEGE